MNEKEMIEAFNAKLEEIDKIAQDMFRGLQLEIEKKASVFHDCIKIMQAIDSWEHSEAKDDSIDAR